MVEQRALIVDGDDSWWALRHGGDEVGDEQRPGGAVEDSHLLEGAHLFSKRLEDAIGQLGGPWYCACVSLLGQKLRVRREAN